MSRLDQLSPEERARLYEKLQRRKAAAAAAESLPLPVEAAPAPSPTGLREAPASFAQERIWLIEQLTPGTATYNVPGALRLRGRLDVPALARAISEIVRRQAALRTVFASEGGRPVQRIEPDRPFPLPQVDLAGLPEERREPEAGRLAGEEVERPFDLAAGPLFRAVLLRLAPLEHLALYTMHHAVSDGWSMGIFFREAAALYEAFAAGRPSPLPELPFQFIDFAVRQRAELAGDALDRSLDWWRQTLAGVAVLELPADHPRAPVRQGRGAAEDFVFRPGLAEALNAVARTGKATLYIALLAAFQALLHRFSGQDDIAVGTPVANRLDRDTEGLIGFFVNTLVMRTDCGGDPPFQELLARARQTALGAFSHQEVPFEKVVEAVQPERVLSRTPLFQVLFGLQNAPIGSVGMQDLVLEQVDTASTTAKLDLTLMFLETPGGLTAGLEYDRDLFEAATATRLLRSLGVLLDAVAGAPQFRLSELPLLSAEQRHQILGLGNRRSHEGARHALPRLFEQQVDRTPENSAVSLDGESLTYRELDARANQLARWLLEAGVLPGDRVALCLDRSFEMIVALLATLKTGAAYLPLDPSNPQDRLAFALEDSAAALVLTTHAQAAALPEGAVRVVLLDEEAEEIATRSAARLDLDLDPELPAYVIYTSGSTGRPKGVVVPHGNVSRLFAATEGWFGFGPEDVWTLFHSYAFDFSAWEIWGALLYGGRLVVVPYWVSREPGAFWRLLVEEGVTVLNQTPSAFRQLGEARGGGALRYVLFGGEALDPTSLELWFNRYGDERPRLVNMYGITETTVHVTYCPLTREDATRPASLIGEPIPDLSLHVLDPHLQIQPFGVPGEICVGGEGLAQGYLGRPELTAERFVPDPFGPPGMRLYRSGDLARRWPDGDLEYLGRIDQQVKIRGFRIELGEIESALAAHPGVCEVAVLALPDADGQRLVAYVVGGGGLEQGGGQEGGGPGLAADLRRWLAERLPEHMIPEAFAILPGLPLTPNGKVDRRALAKIAPERQSGAEHVPPRTAVEQALAEIWVEVLGPERTGGRVGVHDNFFELGGHSLAATRLVARIRAVLGAEVPLRALFEAPTVAGLALRLALAAPDEAPLVSVPRDPAGLPLSFSQERLWVLDRLTPGTSAYNLPGPLRLRGPLDPGLLARCFAEVRRRHEVLRTRFAERGGEPVQVIDPPASFTLPLVDLSGLPHDPRGEEAARLAGEEAGWPFDLERGPLLRVILLRLGGEEHGLLLTLHHIVTDGWSMSILYRELAALYEAFAGGRPSPLPELPVQVADVALWQRERLRGPAFEAQLAWWRERLADAPAALDLPLDRARPAVQTFRGAAVPLLLPPDLAGRLHSLAQREGVSLFMVLLAGLDLLLARWSGQADVLIGTPVAGRGRPELEDLIGFFLNTLVLRVDLSGNPTLRELLGRARETALGAYAHQDVPFEKLLEELQPERDLSRTPLFQVFLNLLNFPEAGARLPGGLVLEPLAGAEADSKFDLTIYASEDGEGIALNLVYNADLFGRARMVELLRQLRHVLERIADAPETPVDAVSLLTSEAAAVLPGPRAPLGDEWRGAVHTLFAEQARRGPGRVAVVWVEKRRGSEPVLLGRGSSPLGGGGLEQGGGQEGGGSNHPGAVRGDWGHPPPSLPPFPTTPSQGGGTHRPGASGVLVPVGPGGEGPGEAGSWTYGELADAAARLAARLQMDGVHPGDPVAIWAERDPSLVWAVMGVLWAGGAFVMLDPAYPPARLAETTRLAAPKYWIEIASAGAPPPEVEEALAETVLGRLALPIPLDALPAPVPPVAVTPDDLAYIAFTSGSTGTPKGILGRHGPLSHFLPFQQERFGIGADERVSLLSGLAHDPLQRDLFTPLCLGGTVCVPAADEIAPGRLAAWMARQGITVAHLTPAMAQLLTEGASEEIPTLRWVLLVGDVLTRLDVDRLRRIAPGVTCVNLYGSTETQRAVAYHVVEEREIADARAPQVLPLGRGMRDVQLLVVPLGRESEALAGIGEVGEIWVRSPHLARGYLGDEALTADRFRVNPFTQAEGDRVYRTGDLGRYRPDGEVTFAGRADQQVKIRGFRIELGEIEAALGRLPGMREAIVLAREMRPGDRRLIAYVTGEGLERGALREAVRTRLPAYMVPADFVLLDRLPVTPNGKVDRRALAKIHPEETEEAAFTAPRTDLERRLAALWSEVLGRARVGLHDDFFDLGGHSLAAARLVARLRAELGVEVPLRTVFEAPTLEALAARCAGLAAGSPAAGPPLVRVPRVQDLPLSVNQERLWFLDRLTPGTATYNLANRARLRGPLDLAALARSLAEIRRRHEVLRTRFEVRGGAAVQTVDPPAAWPLLAIDLSALPASARETEAERWTAAESQQPFDLARGPLARAVLLRFTAEDHGLLLTLHHIVTDGWSMRILLRELTALYQAAVAGAPSPLSELPVQYADFAVWQRARLEGTEQERQIAWWRERLGNHPEPIDLPLDRPRPGVQTFRGASLPFHLPAELAAALRSLRRTEEASLFMVLLAGFDALLHRWSGQDDILVGTPIAGRGRPELEDLIGFFLNTLVLRVDTSGRPGFRELIRRTRETALGAYAHSDVPFEKLLEDLRPERDLSRTPLFQVFFNMLNLPDAGARLPDGLLIEPLTGAEEDAKFDLTVYLAEVEDGIDLHLLYNADLFDRGRMEELLRQYRQLLERAAADPGIPLDVIPLVTPEAAFLLPDPAAPLDDAWRGSVPDLFLERARRHPERPAVVDPDGVWSYGELAGAVERLAARLAAAGVGRGDRVAVWAHRSAPVAWAVHGVLRAGAAFVMLDPAYPPTRILQMLDLAEPRAWLEIEAAGAPPAEGEDWLRHRAADGSLLARLLLPGGGPAGAAATLAGWPETAPGVPLGPDDLAYIAFTSGSTGAPKGIQGRHGPLTHFLAWQHARLDLREDDRYTLLSGLAHDPLQRDLVSSLCTGATLCAPLPEDLLAAGRLAAWAAREEITVAHLTPAMAQVLTEPPAGGDRPTVPTLRRVLLVGDALTRLDVDRLRRLAPGVTCVNLYGSTETQRAVAFHVVQTDPGAAGERARQVLPLGRGMEDVQLLVLNREGALAGIGELGEICVRSPHLSAGYLGDPQLTAEKFRMNPFTGRDGDRLYRTGDLGRYLPDGEVAFAGRADQQVKVRGFRIEPAEIEAALGRLPGVREAVVLLRSAHEGLAAYVVGENGAPPPAAELRAALSERLPAYMVPAWFVPLERLPVTPNGKVDRKALLRIDLRNATGGEAGFVEPRSDLERRIAAVWCEVLGRERIGVRDNFFDLGGHSLLLVRLHARLQEELARDLPLVDLFRHPNVEALAARLAGAAAESESEDVAELEEVVKDRASRQIEAARRQRELARGRRRS